MTHSLGLDTVDCGSGKEEVTATENSWVSFRVHCWLVTKHVVKHAAVTQPTFKVRSKLQKDQIGPSTKKPNIDLRCDSTKMSY